MPLFHDSSLPLSAIFLSLISLWLFRAQFCLHFLRCSFLQITELKLLCKYSSGSFSINTMFSLQFDIHWELLTHLYSSTILSSLLLPSLFKFFHQLLHHLFTIKHNPLSFIFKDLHNLETPSYHILFMTKCQLTPWMDAPLFVILSNKLHATSQTWEEFLRNIFRAANCYHISSLPLKFCIMMLMKMSVSVC